MVRQIVSRPPLGGEADVGVAVEVHVPVVRLPQAARLAEIQPLVVVVGGWVGQGAFIDGLQQRPVPVNFNLVDGGEALCLLAQLRDNF